MPVQASHNESRLADFHVKNTGIPGAGYPAW